MAYYRAWTCDANDFYAGPDFLLSYAQAIGDLDISIQFF